MKSSLHAYADLVVRCATTDRVILTQKSHHGRMTRSSGISVSLQCARNATTRCECGTGELCVLFANFKRFQCIQNASLALKLFSPEARYEPITVVC